MLYVTQLIAETLSTPETRNLCVTQEIVEVLATPSTRNLCVAQTTIEVLRRTSVAGSGHQPIVIIVAG